MLAKSFAELLFLSAESLPWLILLAHTCYMQLQIRWVLCSLFIFLGALIALFRLILFCQVSTYWSKVWILKYLIEKFLYLGRKKRCRLQVIGRRFGINSRTLPNPVWSDFQCGRFYGFNRRWDLGVAVHSGCPQICSVTSLPSVIFCGLGRLGTDVIFMHQVSSVFTKSHQTQLWILW